MDYGYSFFPDEFQQSGGVCRTSPITIEMMPRRVLDIYQEPIIGESRSKVVQIEIKKHPAFADFRVSEFRAAEDRVGSKSEVVCPLLGILGVTKVDAWFGVNLVENLSWPCRLIGNSHGVAEKCRP